MPEPAPLRGLPPLEALARILSLRGFDISAQKLREIVPNEPDASAMGEALEVCGLATRMVKIHPGDLLHLGLPTLLQIKEGGWILLRGRETRHWLVEGASGLSRIPQAELISLLGGTALELEEHLPEASGFWPRVLMLLARRRLTLIRVALAALCMQALALLLPQLTRIIMDRALPQHSPKLLVAMAIGAVLITGFQAWVSWLRERTLLYLETRLDFSLEKGFLDHLLRLPFSFLNKKTFGELIQGFSGLSAAREVATGSALGAFLDGVAAISYLVVLFLTMPGPAGLVIAASILMACLTVTIGHFQVRLQRQEVKARSKEQGFLAELLNGVATIKAAGAERRGLFRWLELLSVEYHLGLRRMRIGLWSQLGLDALRNGMNASILIWGGYMVLHSKAGVGTLMAFILMSSAFLSAFLNLANAYLAFVVLRPQLAPAVEVFEVEASPRASHPVARPLAGPVLVDGVWFRYESNGPWVLQNSKLRVEPGEVHHIVGPSGCGKSTLLRLIAGLFAPNEGSISIGGHAPVSSSGSLIYLPQFVQLYGGSILDNLKLLSGQADMDRLVESAEQTGLQELLDQLPMGLNTILPPGGGNFSGGQRQLIALTATLASQRPLLLLDEAMSNLDWLSQKRINRSAELVGKTIIYTSHEQSYLYQLNKG